MAGRARYCVCQCFFSRNIFLKSYECHVVFENEQQFQNDYKRVGSNLLSFLSLYAALIKGLEPGLWGQLNMFQLILSYQALHQRGCKTEEQWENVKKQVILTNQ